MNDVPAKLVEGYDGAKEPGDFWWTGPDHLTFRCPCGCGGYRAVEVGPGKWQWDGNRERPTITPSIRVLGECGWHGYLTAGIFTTCADFQPKEPKP